jgi:hypothetical protein
VKELNKIIDRDLPGQPHFICEDVVIAGEKFELYSCDVVQCIEALFGNAEFSPHLVFAPEHHYADENKTIWLYHEMHTGKWWWEMQVRKTNVFCINPGAKNSIMHIESAREEGAWCHHSSCHHILQQDAGYTFLQQDGIPCLYDDQ